MNAQKCRESAAENWEDAPQSPKKPIVWNESVGNGQFAEIRRSSPKIANVDRLLPDIDGRLSHCWGTFAEARQRYRLRPAARRSAGDEDQKSCQNRPITRNPVPAGNSPWGHGHDTRGRGVTRITRPARCGASSRPRRTSPQSIHGAPPARGTPGSAAGGESSCHPPRSGCA